MTQRHDAKTLYTRFPHHGLDAYEVALEALAKADALAKKLPRGYGPLADQLRRASQSAFLQLSEGAARSAHPRRLRRVSGTARHALCRGDPAAHARDPEVHRALPALTPLRTKDRNTMIPP